MDHRRICRARQRDHYPSQSESQEGSRYRLGHGKIDGPRKADDEQFFQFIFLNRSWAADRANLTLALTQLGRKARAGGEKITLSSNNDESSTSLAMTKSKNRWPLWLLIFPEGTITSNEERAKSLKYANRENTASFSRSTRSTLIAYSPTL